MVATKSKSVKSTTSSAAAKAGGKKPVGKKAGGKPAGKAKSQTKSHAKARPMAGKHRPARAASRAQSGVKAGKAKGARAAAKAPVKQAAGAKTQAPATGPAKRALAAAVKPKARAQASSSSRPALMTPAQPSRTVAVSPPRDHRPRKQVFRIESPKNKPLQSTFAPADLEVFRRMLEDKRAELHNLYAAELRHSQETNEDGTEDLVDKANNAYSRELSYHISDGERQLLEEIDSALERIEAGSYGICLHSGRPIPSERLKAVPWARYCIESQELFEKGLLD